MGMEVDLSCPQCGGLVPETEAYAAGEQHVRQQRATCPQCRATLVRDLQLEEITWKVDEPAPLSDEEIGVGD